MIVSEEHGVSSKLRPKSRESLERSSFKSSPQKRVHKPSSQLYSPMTNLLTLSKEPKSSQVKQLRNVDPRKKLQRDFQAEEQQQYVLKDTPTKQKDKFHSDFEHLGKIGEGSFGQVFKVREKDSQQLFAVKKSKQQYLGNKDRQIQLEEVRKSFLIQQHGQNALKIVQAWEESGYLFIQSELCEKGNLSDYFLDNQRKSESKKPDAFQKIVMNPQISHKQLEPQMLLSYPTCPQNSDQKEERVMGLEEVFLKMSFSLQQVHRAGFIHLDVKPSNFFVTKNCQIKLGDFGHCKQADKITQFDELEEGDCIYLAPEILDNQILDENSLSQVDFKADLFSLGISFLELATGLNLPQNGPMWQRLREKDKFLVLECEIDQKLQGLINLLLSRNPNQRPDIDQVIRILEGKTDIDLVNQSQNLVIVRPQEFHFKWRNYCKTHPAKRKLSDEQKEGLNLLSKLQSMASLQQTDSSSKNKMMQQKLDFSQFSFRKEAEVEQKEVSSFPIFKLEQAEDNFPSNFLEQEQKVPQNLQELFLSQDQQDVEMKDEEKKMSRKMTFGLMEQEPTQTPCEEDLPRNPETKDSSSRLYKRLFELSEQKEKTQEEERSFRKSFVKPRVLF